MKWRLGLFCLALWFLGGARGAQAHPMGNFSINHYARFGVQNDFLTLRYVLDFAEIPTQDQMATLDKNGDGAADSREKSAYLSSEVPRFLSGLSLQISGKKAVLSAQNSDLQLLAGAGGLPTLRVWMDARTPLSSDKPIEIVYDDANFVGRTGWMEILATGDKTRKIADSDAATRDQSRELTVFPVDAGVVPPRQLSARFSVVSSRASAAPAASQNAQTPPISDAAATVSNPKTPQNRFTQSIAERNLTPALIFWGLVFAFVFGAVHALSPGHGKTMVAAYLVGSRGTPRHAILLGLVVTVTHTFGIFALGLALLFASRYVLPEKLFPALSALSGLLIFGVGLWLLMSRLQANSAHSHSHDGHEHSHDEHSHDERAHSHGAHVHSHGAHVHSHGGRAHSHDVPQGPITLKTLVSLGIAGGIVPCPEALVVLLAAIKLHRIGYGLVLILAFSIGLAAALIAIGMLVVSARSRLSQTRAFSENSALVRFLPIGSAAVITIIGALLTLQATMGAS